jgi:hypothetical protein
MESNQLSVSSGTNTVAAYHRQATDVAGVCKDIVHQTAQSIGGRKYVRVEGWQAIATAHGCVASARDVDKIEGGWRAIGEVRRMDSGSVIATAEGFLGTDEPVWAKRPEYAKRAMAQTRAISRACRSAFAHVVVLIGGGLETTPAEEVPAEGFSDSPRPAPANRPAPRLTDDVIDVVPERISNFAADAAKLHQPDKAPIRKKQPVAATPQAADYETVTLLKVARKEGTSAKGRPWTRWGIMVTRNGSEVWLNTFSEEFGAMIDEANQGDTFHVELKEGERGIDIVDLRVQDVPDRIETAEVVADEQIPF